MIILEIMEAGIGKVNHFVLKVCSSCSILLIGVMTFVVLLGVFFRYFLGNALSWTSSGFSIWSARISWSSSRPRRRKRASNIPLRRGNHLETRF